MIGAQEIAARWAGQPVYQMDFSRLIGSHYTGKNADENQEQYDRSPESAQRLLLQPPSQHRPGKNCLFVGSMLSIANPGIQMGIDEIDQQIEHEHGSAKKQVDAGDYRVISVREGDQHQAS